jgi:hypothetical protein
MQSSQQKIAENNIPICKSMALTKNMDYADKSLIQRNVLLYEKAVFLRSTYTRIKYFGVFLINSLGVGSAFMRVGMYEGQLILEYLRNITHNLTFSVMKKIILFLIYNKNVEN